MTGGEESGEILSLVSHRARPEDDADDSAYGVIRGEREATMLRLIRPNGKPFTAPYSLLSFVWGDFLPALILIEYAGFFTVRLSGDDLTPLEPLISKRCVTWIRACDPATAARMPGAVTGIDILRFYPSREFALSQAGLMPVGA